MANVVIDIAAEYTGNRAFKQAETATEKLQKSVKNLAKTLGLAFSTAAIVNYGKLAVQASLEAQAQQQRLAALLKVTNGATQDQVNVLHQQAAALEQIGVVTGGNITQVQSQLATFDLQLATIKALTPAILDYVVAEKGATASAADFKSMTNGLAQALNGNFASLTRTGFVLDETTKNLIKNGTEAERAEALVKVLNSTYKDFNKNLRDTPMGQFQVLANSAENAKEIIGTDLLAAMQMIAGEDGIGGAADAMERFATQVGNAIYGVGVLIDKIKSIPGITTLLELLALSVKYSPAAGLSALGAANKPGTPAQSPGQRAAIDKANKDALRLQKQQNSLKTIDNNATARKIALTGDELALKELEKKFDVERVGLYAALNQSTSEETKLRLLSLIAIHDQNAAMAGMIKKADEAKDAFAALIQALRATISAMFEKIAPELSQLQALTGNAPSNMPENAGGINPPNYGALDTPLNAGSFAIGERDTLRAMGIGVVNVNVQGSVTTERDLVNAITQGIYNNQASGIPINYSTSYV
jgi:hypothetical protein